MITLTNWANNYHYHATRLHCPETVQEVCEIVRGSNCVKPLGSRHSFNAVADTTGDLVSLERLGRVLSLDTERQTVTVEGGIRYGPLSQYLHAHGFALHNLASLPHISVAGAVATATHGSGETNACLSTAIVALEFVTASGDIVSLSRERNSDMFCGAVVNLGALGFVTQLTLKVEPTFNVRQDVYENLPFATAETHFDAIISAGYSVSLFTDWRDGFTQVWRKRRVIDNAPAPADREFFGATLAAHDLHPLAGCPERNCTAQGGISGPWHERLPHFRMELTPSAGDELQTEYLIPRTHALDALRAVNALSDRITPLLQISEIRMIAADNLWMSPFYQQAGVGIHFTWKKDWDSVRDLLPNIEERLAPYKARPHWGKLFTTPSDQVRALYPRLPDFQALARRFDPQRKFRNAFLDDYIYAEG